ncbi:valine--tRNA ligase [Candidatus Microgenomates bacterium]|nr:valine--tRNA ligase [Candidatus Microgenomates bacterium]
MEKTYQSSLHEEKIYSLWETGNYFRPIEKSTEPKKTFVMMMPPPNVTGALHIGHALTAATEDILVRFHRMLGETTLWLPGVDHAGIATQNVVERALAKDGKNRIDLGREKFVEEVWQWVEKYGHTIDDQHKKLGVSADWSRRRFTMDEDYQQAVQIAFNTLKEKGLIYQGEYIVNWCPRCASAISDLENIYEEQNGKLYFLDYGLITIATTRPETIFADSAIAVNPKDSRYQKLVGKFAAIPLINKEIPIISDMAVDQNFGTGALKVTPAHDQTDFEIGRRHNLPRPSVIDKNGKMASSNLVPQKYWGMEVQVARDGVAKDLQNSGLLKKEESHQNNVGHCQRCDTITQPLLSLQWFVKTTAMARAAIEAVKKGEIKIIPKRFEKVYFQWLENIHDWCISRQIWWGHSIPDSNDVLDTWFSSSLWPFATLGWPKQTANLQRFFPTTVLETGYDILFFWVAKMIMMSTSLTGKPPFETVYLHGLVRDIQGRKMSKTLGNVIDPLEYIGKYGTDSLRMALVVGTTAGNDSKISEEKVVGYRNFTNKVWNIARFILSYESGTQMSNVKTQNEDDKWIRDELVKTIKSVTRHLHNFRLSPAGEEIYDFIWKKLADIYLEKTKSRRQEAQPTLLYVLDRSLRLLHPFMPFVTEVIWQTARETKRLSAQAGLTPGTFQEEALITAQWPR